MKCLTNRHCYGDWGPSSATSRAASQRWLLNLMARQRQFEGAQGELFLNVAFGYIKVSHDQIEKDPDRCIQEALALVFAKFAEMQTLRQVHLQE